MPRQSIPNLSDLVTRLKTIYDRFGFRITEEDVKAEIVKLSDRYGGLPKCDTESV